MKPLREFFDAVAPRPVEPVKRGPPVVADTRWKLLDGVGLTKTYAFSDRTLRDHFVVRGLAQETYRAKAGVRWEIDGDNVTITLALEPVGVTEPMVELATALDDTRRDLVASLAAEKDEWSWSVE